MTQASQGTTSATQPYTDAQATDEAVLRLVRKLRRLHQAAYARAGRRRDRRRERREAGVSKQRIISVRVSSDFDAYATGRLDAASIRCVLCQHAPCDCPPFGTPEYLALFNRRHGRA